MGYFKRRREIKEKNKRIDQLSPEEVQEIVVKEKDAYTQIVKRQVAKRGIINAYKDFPLPESEINFDDEEVEEEEVEEESEEEEEEE